MFFTYEMSPLQISYKESKRSEFLLFTEIFDTYEFESTRSVGHFATDVCTIIGGVFTVAGIIDSFLYRSSKLLQQKLQLGKST